MMKKKKKIDFNFALVAVVIIVAIIGIVFMVTKSGTQTQQGEYKEVYDEEGNLIGEAFCMPNKACHLGTGREAPSLGVMVDKKCYCYDTDANRKKECNCKYSGKQGGCPTGQFCE